MSYANADSSVATPIGQLPYDYSQYFNSLVNQLGIAIGERFAEVDESVRLIAIEEIRERLTLSEAQMSALETIKRMVDANPNDGEALTEGRNLWVEISEKFEAAMQVQATFETTIAAVNQRIDAAKSTIDELAAQVAALAARVSRVELAQEIADRRVTAILQGIDGMLDGLNAAVLNFRGRIGLKS